MKGICVAALISLLLGPSMLMAQNCGHAENTLAIIACHEKRYEKADMELNKVYGDVMRSLPPGGRQKLKEAQRAWLQYRDANLALAIEINKDLRSYGNVVVADYRATIVEKRVLELKYLMSGPEGPAVAW
jgi:uncharacterized protein YecT (DUF1311 family)